MRCFLLHTILLFLFSLPCVAQFTLDGKVINEQGEALDFAVVYLKDSPFSSVTNGKGFFSIPNIPSGVYTIETTFLGYQNYSQSIFIDRDTTLLIALHGHLFNLDEIEIVSNSNKSTAYPAGSTIGKEELKKNNYGQDVPVLLQLMPSTSTATDAGAGVGYTYLRLRGIDQARINVTINDIPINDAESQNVYWVDLPDITSSTQSIKIQRGVGPSTNGSGAYGGSVALSTFGTSINPSIDVNASYGSFNTRKLSVNLTSGLMNNKFIAEGRYSTIASDGYIDRASASLSSWMIGLSKISSSSSIRFITFAGKEVTYQAWNGVPQALLDQDQSALVTHYYNNKSSLYPTTEDSLNLFSGGRKYNLYRYPDQKDNYYQHHSQLHFAKTLSPNIISKFALHYTKGKGYFEQYRYQDALSKYNLPFIVSDQDTILNATLTRRRWLDNHFYGLVTKTEFKSDNHILSVGGGISFYDGHHFGDVIALLSPSVSPFPIVNPYYKGCGKKTDGNAYLRSEWKLAPKFNASIDLQLRHVSHKIDGEDNDQRLLDVEKKYLFFNPKFAANFLVNNHSSILASFGIANREPDRSDLLDNPKNALPKAEKLFDTELNYIFKKNNLIFDANLYFMKYKDQLVATGELNDVGNVLRTNVPKSHRLGLELSIATKLHRSISWQANATVSQNKIRKFTEVIYDYTSGFDVVSIDHHHTDIALSPSILVGSNLDIALSKTSSLTLSSKYVGRQYLDNTSNKLRSLAPYSFTNIYFKYTPSIDKIKSLSFTALISNVFNQLYSSNGYTYSYKYEGLITENFYYPQAGRHISVGIAIKL